MIFLRLLVVVRRTLSPCLGGRLHGPENAACEQRLSTERLGECHPGLVVLPLPSQEYARNRGAPLNHDQGKLPRSVSEYLSVLPHGLLVFAGPLPFGFGPALGAHSPPLNSLRRGSRGAKSSEDCASSISVATRLTPSPVLATETCGGTVIGVRGPLSVSVLFSTKKEKEIRWRRKSGVKKEIRCQSIFSRGGRPKEIRCQSIFSRGGRPRRRGSRTMPRRRAMTSTHTIMMN